jgi:hypothetical protein
MRETEHDGIRAHNLSRMLPGLAKSYAHQKLLACSSCLSAINIIIIIPREGVGGALGATARKPSLPIPIWRSQKKILGCVLEK